MTDDATLAVLKSIQKTLAEHTVALGQVRAISVSAKLHGENAFGDQARHPRHPRCRQ
jgi:sugar (pentulose or hexulose) kinase